MLGGSKKKKKKKSAPTRAGRGLVSRVAGLHGSQLSQHPPREELLPGGIVQPELRHRHPIPLTRRHVRPRCRRSTVIEVT